MKKTVKILALIALTLFLVGGFKAHALTYIPLEPISHLGEAKG